MYAYLILFVFLTLIYFYVSWKKKRLINILFFIYISEGLIMVFLYTISLSLNGITEVGRGDALMITYFLLQFICAAFVELRVKPINGMYRKKEPTKIDNRVLIAITGVVCFWFLMNADTFLLAISNPRMFYANTRIGGGLIYFVIIPLILLLYFALICGIDYNKKTWIIKSFLLTAAAFVFLYVFGQKSNMLIIAFIFLTTYFYKSKNKKRNQNLIRLGLVFFVAFVVVFALYSAQQSISYDNALLGMVTYSDYLSNFNKLVDNMTDFKYGALFLQDEFLGYIPRAIWSEKPTLYGSLTLGLEVPELVEWTLALTGAPSFGPLGQTYGDFGILCVPILLIKDLMFFVLAKTYEEKLKRRYNFFDHFLFLTFVGVRIFSITLTTFPVYQLVVIFLLIAGSKKHNSQKVFTSKDAWKYVYFVSARK